MPSRWTRGSRVNALALCQILCMASGTRAQSIADPEPVPQASQASQAPQASQEPAHPVTDHVASSPLDVAGYNAVRNLMGDDLADRNAFREYSGSIFVSKNIG